jgi:surface antigen
MIDINQFVEKWNGKECNTGPYPDQCVNVIKEWCAENGWPTTWGNAIDYWNNGEAGWTKTANTPTGVPPAGAIAVFNVGQYGHVALVLPGSNQLTLVTFEQNDPLGSYCHVHNYNYLRPQCLGWLTKD